MPVADQVIARVLGLQPYEPTWRRMQTLTAERGPDTLDEIWLLEHEPVFTQGQAGKAEHLLNPGDIPVIQADRGGQVTYHGPGQLLAYLMVDLRRRKLGVRDMVNLMEATVVRVLADFDIQAYPKPDAPGVYVDEAKICSLGLRVRRGCSFHGLALNLNMDLAPFLRINPCGYSGLQMTQLSMLRPDADIESVPERLLNYLIEQIGYTSVSRTTSWND
ncbi:Octanoate-[acyl-carrier-protein]-protein-N-octan oyltransferase [Marinobacterium lacunae]|uniref:Octanoyltransferase n=1 Tax=Marinobacterium lacunae TaxID=1232683 RepID=A0A081G1B4_9GAMM|nr:lipoyl(octanoyl) transferase LipB [Marinobacterium lacunae]KEA64569.1 Octanoate-[acyl-carrier-protein]-protein-N-octan oyltransferase [Marinobacterium lacunae]